MFQYWCRLIVQFYNVLEHDIIEHKFNFWVKGSWECYADSCFMFVLFMASYWPRDPHLLLALQQLSSLEGELNSSCRTQTLQLLFNSPIPLIGQSMVTLASDWLTLTRCLCRGCGHKVRYWLTSSLNSSIILCHLPPALLSLKHMHV